MASLLEAKKQPSLFGDSIGQFSISSSDNADFSDGSTTIETKKQADCNKQYELKYFQKKDALVTKVKHHFQIKKSKLEWNNKYSFPKNELFTSKIDLINKHLEKKITGSKQNDFTQ